MIGVLYVRVCVVVFGGLESLVVSRGVVWGWEYWVVYGAAGWGDSLVVGSGGEHS